MSRKRFCGLAALLSAMVVVVVPAVAQAEPHWYKKAVLLGPAPLPVPTAGNLTLNALGVTIVCKVNDTEEIWNPVGGGAGQDLVTAFALTKCKVKAGNSACPKGPVEVLANGLPWPSHLIPGPPIRDEIQKMRLLVRCIPGTVGTEFEGSLTPEVGEGELIFGPGSGMLTSGVNTLTVGGTDKFITKKGKVTAKDP